MKKYYCFALCLTSETLLNISQITARQREVGREEGLSEKNGLSRVYSSSSADDARCYDKEFAVSGFAAKAIKA